MAQPMMPKATAVWLVDHTALTFRQIADFCGLHELEIQAIADGEVVSGMAGMDPTANGQLSADEIKRCEADPAARLQMQKSDMPAPVQRAKGARYTPIAGSNSCSPARADQTAFRVRPGAPMPEVEGCNKQDYAVLFVIAVAVDN